MTSETFMENGLGQIASAFKHASQKQTAAFMPYFTLGYPDIETSLDIIERMAEYSDLIELGVPFSDPLADGPTVQHSTQVALENGVTVAGCMEMVARLRERGVSTPACYMGYYNPIIAYGIERFVVDARAAGIQGLIVPDLPPEEANELAGQARNHGLAYIYLLAPTSSQKRIEQVAALGSGFIYLVSVTGVTGARSSLQQDLESFIGHVRDVSALPLAVGFGISTPQQAAEVGRLADGVIVGSALINAVDRSADKPSAAAAFTKSLYDALSLQSSQEA
jgi:tryptophan synthase alpha chain